MKQQLFMLGNLTCPNCASKLEAAARRLRGVAAAAVSFGAGSLTVTYDAEQVAETDITELAARLDVEVISVLDQPGL